MDDALAPRFPQAAADIRPAFRLPHRDARLARQQGDRACNRRTDISAGWRWPLCFWSFVAQACAETIAETASKWGLIGPWSLDCSLPPDRDKGTVLAYETTSEDGVVHRRNFGGTTD